MKKYLALLLLLPLLGFGARLVYGQFGATNAIDILPPTTLVSPIPSSQQTIGLTALRPTGVSLKAYRRAMAVVQVNTAASAGSLDVYLQASPDCGMCWQDFAHVHATGAGTFHVPISLHGDGGNYPTTVLAMNDGTLANGVIIPYLIGDKVRVKYNATFNVNATGAWSFHVFVIPD